VSEISWRHIEHPAEVLKIGQEVTVEVLGIEDDKERVSLSIKSTQEDPWQVFARSHAIGQIVPGEIVKIVQFGVFIRVGHDIEGLVHISEMSDRHIASADQIATKGDNAFAKIVDIDLERRRISLSIKQASQLMDVNSDEFDPALYGAATDFDDNGNYIYPEGFDPAKNEWKPGFDDQKAQWEANYVAARSTWEAHKAYVVELTAKEEGIAPAENDKSKALEKKRTRKSEPQNQSFGEVNTSGALEGNADLEALKESLKG
jgi:small subunit ribosomal protein S1